ncbi:ribonuclease HII [Halorussus amylolyticus]|uniref:ribonuclease HII n=1 Tax=Halorussus amylolyticus TaxID=1126242 RepID=UPI0010467937|nr:ribonuclease HII [Halorussus amylolyticus]
MFGVDEAGKGPVLGSMFAAAVAVGDPAALPDDVDDSKKIAPDRREELAAALRDDDRVAVGVAEIPVARIDDPETDMNTLTVAGHAEALSKVADDGAEGFADAGDTSESRFARRVRERVAADIDLVAEHGADETYPVVSAASVVAKVARDSHVASLADEYGPVGSGYPSDPTTREFLAEYVAEYGELPDCARRIWATCEDVLAAHEQSGLGEF